jgi:L-fuculose-phosphate aldolase
LVPNVHTVCGKIGMAEYGLPGSTELGEKIALEFKKGFNTVILENHGIVVGGNNLFEAFMAFETLDFCARLEIDARSIGRTIALSEADIELSKIKQHKNLEEFIPDSFSSLEREARRVMCELIHRAYDQKLFTSTEGTFSRRLSDDSFLITPFNVDRKYIEPEDIVRVDNGHKEAGKTTSRSVMLHKAIYEKHPHINSVIIAHAPNIMAFAVTDVDFDSRTIPESYILLRNIPKMSYGSVFMETEKLADKFVPSTPIVLVKNDCIIATGSSLINAFDRLEVAEYSAKAIIASKKLGDIVVIDDEKIAELEIAFNLEK